MSKRRWITGGALAAALLVGACGGRGGTTVEADKPIDAVLASTERMAQEKSSKVTFVMKMDAEGELVEITGDGAFDYTNATGTFVMDMPEIQGTKIGRIEAVLVDNVLYEKFPPELAANLGGKPWIKIDLKQAMGADLTQMAQAQSSNPTQIAALTLGAERVEEVGTEDVRGVATTHYKVTINLQKALAEAEDPELKKVVEQAAAVYATDTIPMEIWMDDDGLPRRMRFIMDMSQMEVPEADGAMTGTMDITMDMFDFGTEVTAVAPPADQVTDLATLMEQAGR